MAVGRCSSCSSRAELSDDGLCWSCRASEEKQKRQRAGCIFLVGAGLLLAAIPAFGLMAEINPLAGFVLFALIGVLAIIFHEK